MRGTLVLFQWYSAWLIFFADNCLLLVNQNLRGHSVFLLGIRAHELRALSAASLALRKGASLADLLEAVGWASGSTFIEHYWRDVDLPTHQVPLPSL